MRRSIAAVVVLIFASFCSCTGGDTRPPPSIADSVSELEQTSARVNRFRNTLKNNLATYQSGMSRMTEFRGLDSEAFPMASFKHALVSCFNQTVDTGVDVDPALSTAAEQAGVTCAIVVLPSLLDALRSSPDRTHALEYVKFVDNLRLSRIEVQTDIRNIDRIARTTLRYVTSRRRESTRFSQQLDRDRDLYSGDDYSRAIKRISKFRSELDALETLAKRLRTEQDQLSSELLATTRVFYDNVVPLGQQ